MNAEDLLKEIAQLERSCKGWEDDALRYHHNAEYWKSEYLRLRAALERVTRAYPEDACDIASEALEGIDC